MSPSDGGADPSSGAGCGNQGEGEEINVDYHHRQVAREQPTVVVAFSSASMEIAAPRVPSPVRLRSTPVVLASHVSCRLPHIVVHHGCQPDRAWAREAPRSPPCTAALLSSSHPSPTSRVVHFRHRNPSHHLRLPPSLIRGPAPPLPCVGGIRCPDGE
uniref:Uncharacterized protein n=1 Tax=Aegilops tauschii subsp. strangulata TaxID=200361 RepID=A0A453HLT0_AEGTS